MRKEKPLQNALFLFISIGCIAGWTLVIEDDFVYTHSIITELKTEFNNVDILLVETEKDFYERFKEIEQFNPDIIILDVMIRWNNREAIGEQPSDDLASDFFRAGFRCLELISNSNKLFDVPVVLHTVLDWHALITEVGNLPKHVVYLNKNSLLDKLLMTIRSSVRALSQDDIRQQSVASKLLDSTELKPGWLGFSIDLKPLSG